VETEGSRPKKRTTIYMDPNIWREFGIICSREDKSKSEKIEGFVGRYVAVHMKGNPQLLLAPFIGEVKKVCFGCEGIFPALTRVMFISKVKAGVCKSCLEDYQKRTTIKKIYK